MACVPHHIIAYVLYVLLGDDLCTQFVTLLPIDDTDPRQTLPGISHPPASRAFDAGVQECVKMLKVRSEVVVLSNSHMSFQAMWKSVQINLSESSTEVIFVHF